jgi:peptidoglycan/xylan/chitin deacetylase (PgdA/CDA1 family)
MYFLATNDVELTSIRFNKQREQTGNLVLKEGLPLLFDLYSRYQVKATFFVTGDIAEAFPSIPQMIVDAGHELGCHGYGHTEDSAFDNRGYSEQYRDLVKAKEILEQSGCTEVVSFRAPALRVNRFTPQALADAGFKVDSSISSQRADMFFSFGAIKKINRLWAPRMPYTVAKDGLDRKGDLPILEIPISAIGLPYIGTTLRIAPAAVRMLRYLLHAEAVKTGKPVNFLIHPNECIIENDDDLVDRRSSNPVKYLFAERLRRKMKLFNLGPRAIQLYEEHLAFFQVKGYDFITCKEYRRKFLGN